MACSLGSMAVVREMLADPHVDHILSDICNRTPLWYASWFGHVNVVVELLIASGRDLGDVKSKKGSFRDEECTSLEMARKENRDSLLERFLANPTQTRYEVKFV